MNTESMLNTYNLNYFFPTLGIIHQHVSILTYNFMHIYYVSLSNY